jgi:CheY-like chemotaxis protein
MTRSEDRRPARQGNVLVQGLNVLVVDDNRSARDVLRDHLSSLCCSCQQAATGEEAVDAIRKAGRSGKRFDVILIDWLMEGINCLETIRSIVELGIDVSSCILMVPAVARDSALNSAGNLATVQILDKPVTHSRLLDVLIKATVLPESSEQIQETIIPGESKQLTAGARILLVEDNEDNQLVGVELLKLAGCNTDVAENGEIAVRMARQGSYDLILMDMQMPVMDGLTATRKMRSIPELQAIPIIAMTANAMQSDQQLCIESGMNDFISKPIEPAFLWRTIEKWLMAVPREQPQIEKRINAPGQVETNDHANLPFGIEGLDVEAGFKLVMHNAELYHQLLRNLVTNYEHIAENIAQALNEGDYPLAERLAHTFKSVAAGVGAHQPSTLAGNIENSIRKGASKKRLDSLIDSLAESLSDLIPRLKDHIHRSQSRTDSPEVVEPGRVNETTKKLKQLLLDNDPRAIDVLAAHSGDLKTVFKDHFEALEKHVLNFDFNRGLEVISHIDDNF